MSKRRKFGSGDFDRIDGIWWGGAFVWAALVMLAANTDWGLPNWWDNWGVFFVGAGVLALVCAAIRLNSPEYRSKWFFSAVFGVIFLAIGFGAWDAGWWFWVLLLLIVGVAILRSALNRQS